MAVPLRPAPGAVSGGAGAPPVGKLDAIQLLRALAACVVVLGHVMGTAARLQAPGGAFVRPSIATGAGVDLFFLISGFIMVVSSRRMFGAPDGPRDFLLRRLVRIVPLYWGVTTLALLLAFAGNHQALPRGVAILASYAFIPFDTTGRGDGFAFPIVDLGWTLNYEMLFYVLFAAGIRAGRERCIMIVTAALIALVALGTLWQPAPVAVRFWTQPIMFEFAAGMWLALLLVRGQLRLPPAVRIVLLVAGLAALAWNPLPALHQPTTLNGFVRLLGWGVPAAALLLAAIGGPLPVRSRVGRAVVLVGDASYALYLVHPFWLLVVDRAHGHGVALLGNAYAAIAIGWVGAILVAIAVHLALERPLTRGLTRLLQRGGAPIHAVPLVDAREGNAA
ncbi:acyltransferase family protein [Sphingomonas nostoxanthinifaciens]|uniref:acyltransferase family protein n=1 Tax=Sphingomonas nostoxanthinifaciens TaxID=2872652 RepID=UPI001CC2154C|nr:acyltransferase [Sphingomonas nostoxanthinifaciens]UAK23394.1 acyltransferase [Sphingomonas nostoxanthinifaciens]